MSNITINGKKPLSSKAKPAPLALDDIFGNQLGVDPELLKAIEAKGNDYRFINVKILQDMGGYHQYGWRPVKLKELYDRMDSKPTDTQSFQFGMDPEGYVRRGDLILAVRPKTMGDKHKAYLKQENDRVSLAVAQKRHAEEMRSLVHQRGGGMKVHEGYEDENE